MCSPIILWLITQHFGAGVHFLGAPCGGMSQERKPSASEVLEALLNGRQGTMPLPAKGSADVAAAKRALLLPEGTHIADRVGLLRAEGDQWVLVFEGGDPAGTMKLLPNLILERMIQRLRVSAIPPAFIVSGQITECLGENYLLAVVALERVEQGNLKK